MITRWLRSTSNFYGPIGQNLTGECICCGVYLGNSCLLITEAGRISSNLVMFLTVSSFLDVRNEIQLLLRFLLFMAGFFVS